MVDYHPFSAELYDDPWPIYRRLRDEAPAFYLAFVEPPARNKIKVLIFL